jgi:hypothetical protein
MTSDLKLAALIIVTTPVYQQRQLYFRAIHEVREEGHIDLFYRPGLTASALQPCAVPKFAHSR